jgi:hypothetical protein
MKNNINYLIGILITDSYIANRKSGVYANLEITDEQLINDICEEFGTVKRSRNRVIANKMRFFHSTSFTVAKTKEIGLSNVLDRYNGKLHTYYLNLSPAEKCNLIRGIFDGDGTVCNYHNSKNLRIGFVVNSKHEDILKIIEDFFREDWGLSKYHDKRGGGVYNFNIGAKKNIDKFFKLIYQDEQGIKLNRKYEKFLT